MTKDNLTRSEYLTLKLECLRMALSIEFYNNDYTKCYELGQEFLKWLLREGEANE